MIRKRFPAHRVRRLVAWTSLAIAWSTALVARGLTTPEPTATAQPAPPPPPAPTATTVPSSMPTMPADGLVVLHYTPVEKPAPEVRRVVVTRTVAAPAPAPVATSSGS